MTQSLRRWVWLLPLCITSACLHTDALSPGDLPGGTAVVMHLNATWGTGVGTSIEIAAAADSVRVVWKVDEEFCLLSSASAARAAGVLLIEIARSGDPLADCIEGTGPRIYEATTARLPSGTYAVHVLASMFGQPTVGVGSATVTVAR